MKRCRFCGADIPINEYILCFDNWIRCPKCLSLICDDTTNHINKGGTMNLDEARDQLQQIIQSFIGEIDNEVTRQCLKSKIIDFYKVYPLYTPSQYYLDYTKLGPYVHIDTTNYSLNVVYGEIYFKKQDKYIFVYDYGTGTRTYILKLNFNYKQYIKLDDWVKDAVDKAGLTPTEGVEEELHDIIKQS